MKKLIINTLIIILVCVFSSALNGQNPGDLYEDFGTDGISTFDYLGLNQVAYDMVIQENDKIIAVGKSGSNALIVKFNSTGSIDAGFGNNGRVLINLGESVEAKAIDISEDGKIVVAGYSLNKVFVAQLLSDGSFDSNFSSDGILEIYSEYLQSIEDIALLPNGKIIAVGHYENSVVTFAAIVRIRPDGNIDLTFGENGYSYISYDGLDLAYFGTLLDNDGNLFSVGLCEDYDELSVRYLVTKHQENGSLDESFGDNGVVIGGENEIIYFSNDIILDNDNKLVFAGMLGDVNTDLQDGFVMRLLLNGEVDDTFGNNGLKIYNTGTEDFFFSLCQQDDDKYVLAGVSDNRALVYRTLNNGSPDVDFGIDGYVLTDVYGDRNWGFSIGLQSDLNIVVTGSVSEPGEDNDFAVFKYYSGMYVGQREWSKQISDINLYPNPASDYLNIDFRKIQPINIKISIYQINGTLVFEERGMIFNGSYHLENLSLNTGVYMLKVNTEWGETVRKLIIN